MRGATVGEKERRAGNDGEVASDAGSGSLAAVGTWEGRPGFSLSHRLAAAVCFLFVLSSFD